MNLSELILESDGAKDFLGKQVDVLDEFLNSGCDRMVLIDALSVAFDRAGIELTFDQDQVASIAWRNRP